MAIYKKLKVFDTVEEYWKEDTLDLARETTHETKSIEEFETNFIDYLGGKGTAIFLPSGREAIQIITSFLNAPKGSMILVPNFICHVVGEAILQGGYQICAYDFSPNKNNINLESFELCNKQEKIAAIIAPHLFGLPQDITSILEFAHHHNIPVIEDCAHTLGARIHREMAGTLGDYSIFSFNYDKPISLGGGMLVINHPSIAVKGKIDQIKDKRNKNLLPIEVEYQALSKFREWLSERRENIPKTNGITLALIYKKIRWKIATIPILKNLIKPPPLAPWESGIGSLRASLGILLLKKYPSVMAQRNKNYSLFEELMSPLKKLLCQWKNHHIWYLNLDLNRICGGQSVQNNLFSVESLMQGENNELLYEAPEIMPAWLKAKLIIPNLKKEEVDILGKYMCSKGFRVGRFNWSQTLSQIIEIGTYAGSTGSLPDSERFANLSLDFPIHQNMTEEDIKRMVNTLKNYADTSL